MATVTRHFCDVCSAEVNPAQGWEYKLTTITIDVNGPPRDEDQNHFDVCPKCRISFLETLRDWKSSRDPLSAPKVPA